MMTELKITQADQADKLLDAGHIYKHHGYWPHEKVWEPDMAKCRVAVHDGRGWPSFHQCSRKASVQRDVEHNGKLATYGYCKTHDPVAVAEKERKWRAKYDAEAALRTAQWTQERMRHEAIEVLRHIANGHNDPCALAGELIDRYDATGG